MSQEFCVEAAICGEYEKLLEESSPTIICASKNGSRASPLKPIPVLNMESSASVFFLAHDFL